MGNYFSEMLNTVTDFVKSFIPEEEKQNDKSTKKHQEEAKRKTSRSDYTATDPRRSFTSAEDAGRYGETLLQEELRRLKGTVINGYITTANILFDEQNFEIDFLVMVPGVGLIVAEVKYFSGDVYCTEGRYWKQKKINGTEVETRNASKQSLRTRAILKKLLVAKNLNKWPIKPLVIFVHPEARIFKGKATRKPQTEILKLDMFAGWVDQQKKRDSLVFTQDDFQELYKSIKSEEKEFKMA